MCVRLPFDTVLSRRRDEGTSLAKEMKNTIRKEMITLKIYTEMITYNTCVYIYIYIERERETQQNNTEKEQQVF